MFSRHHERLYVHRIVGAAALLLLFTLIPLLHPVPANAHGPKTVLLTYDLPSQTLNVTITHGSPSPTNHYIKRVVIKKDGKVLETAEYKSQPDTPQFTYTYKIAAASGDTLEVKVTCNIFGSKTEKITIPAISK